MAEVMVRMGELAVSASAEDVLASLGLGSCIGLALIDRGRGVAGLAHIMLPESKAVGPDKPGKFADTGVPTLLRELATVGALRPRVEAVMVGGAQMLGAGSRLDIGARNASAVRAALAQAGVRVFAHATGGTRGRTIRVRVGEGVVTVKEAGDVEAPLWAGPRILARSAR